MIVSKLPRSVQGFRHQRCRLAEGRSRQDFTAWTRLVAATALAHVDQHDFIRKFLVESLAAPNVMDLNVMNVGWVECCNLLLPC